MIILLALLLLSSSTYSMLDYMGRPLRNSEAVFKDCQESLALYDDFLPGAPAMSLIAAHPKFIELMQRDRKPRCFMDKAIRPSTFSSCCDDI